MCITTRHFFVDITVQLFLEQVLDISAPVKISLSLSYMPTANMARESHLMSNYVMIQWIDVIFIQTRLPILQISIKTN